MWTALLLLACANEGATSGVECDTDEELRGSTCYPIDDDTDAEDTEPPPPGDPVEAAFEAYPPCALAEPDGRLDLDEGCADGACVGMTVPEITTVLDEEPVCYPSSTGWLWCTWSNGVAVYSIDPDDDGTPDPDYRVTRINLGDPFSGATGDGLALFQSVRCWIDELGDPDRIELREYPQGWSITTLDWDYPSIVLWDFWDEDYDERPDGEADYLYLYGP